MHRIRRHSTALVVLVVLVGTVVASVGVAASAPPASTLARNRSAARVDARRLLRSLNLPPGAVELPSTGKPAPALTSSMARTGAEARWSVPLAYTDAYAYITAHPPAGTKVESTGSSGGPQPADDSSVVTFARPAVAGELSERWLTVTVADVSPTESRITAVSEVVWVVPRPATERVPARARELDVTVTSGTGRVLRSHTFAWGAKVRRTIALIDRLMLNQPAAYSCPALITGGDVITLTFRAGLGGPALAQASFTDYPGLGGVSYPCNPVDFTVGGRTEPTLIGGHYVRALREILGAGVV